MDYAKYVSIWTSNLPLKVRKALLLQNLGFPLDETLIFSIDDLQTKKIDNVFSKISELLIRHKSVAIRTAGNPPQGVMPWFIVSDTTALKKVFNEVVNIQIQNPLVSHFLVHSDFTDSESQDDKQNYITGRFLLHKQDEEPRESTIEMVYGEYHPAILENIAPNSEKLARYKKEFGQWSQEKICPFISPNDFHSIISQFNRYEINIEILRSIIGNDLSRNPKMVTLCFDFVASKGTAEKFITYDFDYS